APSRRQTGAVSFARYPQARSIRESITDRRGSSQGLAAVRDFDPAYVGSGSFTSFPLSRRVRFAPRAELPQRHHSLVILDLVARGIGSDRLGNEARRHGAVMLTNHAGAPLAQLTRHHHQRLSLPH